MLADDLAAYLDDQEAAGVPREEAIASLAEAADVAVGVVVDALSGLEITEADAAALEAALARLEGEGVDDEGEADDAERARRRWSRRDLTALADAVAAYLDGREAEGLDREEAIGELAEAAGVAWSVVTDLLAGLEIAQADADALQDALDELGGEAAVDPVEEEARRGRGRTRGRRVRRRGRRRSRRELSDLADAVAAYLDGREAEGVDREDAVAEVAAEAGVSAETVADLIAGLEITEADAAALEAALARLEGEGVDDEGDTGGGERRRSRRELSDLADAVAAYLDGREAEGLDREEAIGELAQEAGVAPDVVSDLLAGVAVSAADAEALEAALERLQRDPDPDTDTRGVGRGLRRAEAPRRRAHQGRRSARWAVAVDERVDGWLAPQLRAEGEASGTTDFVFSSDVEARDGDIIDQESWILDEYLLNPVVLSDHDMREVVGVTERLGVQGGRLLGSIRWDESPENPRGQLIASQHRRGFRSAVSVRWITGRAIERNKLPKDDPRYHEGRHVETPWGDYHAVGRVLYDCVLLEVSSVSVGSDPTALQVRGLPRDDQLRILRGAPHGADMRSVVAELVRAGVLNEALDEWLIDRLRRHRTVRDAIRAIDLSRGVRLEGSAPSHQRRRRVTTSILSSDGLDFLFGE